MDDINYDIMILMNDELGMTRRSEWLWHNSKLMGKLRKITEHLSGASPRPGQDRTQYEPEE
jgi:hypothetical protein